ncbi:MAG: quinolinate synthase NadA [Candidatus Omnitrophica bacterium]|jgi:quinolinate synthase|nr:quinolinate synthase NadA [Candidatus Omnitrophota bacterium]
MKNKFDSFAQEIKQLKKKRNAVILAHNYQLPEVQDIADFHGDSLELARKASKTQADVIVFCGVYFMAETASILCPKKTILMPDTQAACPMANMITAQDIRGLRAKYPEAVVVGYVNTPAQVKAELDICCTSTNAAAVVNHFKDKKIIFVPDKYLAEHTSKVSGKKLISWNGFCPTHVRIRPEDIKREKKFHPFAKVIAHPECLPEVLALSDAVLSTSKMCSFAKETEAKEIIVATEVGMVYRLKKDNPDKEFYPATEAAVCPNMKRTTQEKVIWALKEMREEVRVPEDIRARSLKAINLMLQIV